MQFEDTVRKIIEKECEDYFLGVADLSLAKKAVIQQYGSLIDKYPLAISIGLTLPIIVQNQLSRTYKNTVLYNETDKQLDIITTKLSGLLQNGGYKAFSVPKIEMNEEKIFINLHKLAANLAGLAWIEKNDLLVTPEAGSRVNWATVLTDAPLESDKPMNF